MAYENNLNINIDCRLNERKIGYLEELKKLERKYNHSFTEEQLLNGK